MSALAELAALEPIFHWPDRTQRADVERMIDDGFWEVGASGRVYDRDFVLRVLDERGAEPRHDDWKTSDFRCQHLGGDAYLLTYRLEQGARVTRRSTIWRRDGDGWRAVFHQGTVVAP